MNAWDDGDNLASLYDGIPVDERSPILLSAVALQLNRLNKDGARRLDEGLLQFPGDFWIHFSLGCMNGKDRTDARISAFRAALAIRPSNAVVFFHLGNLFYEKTEYGNAALAYKQAIRLDPQNAYAHNNLGNAQHMLGNDLDAVHEYNESHRLDSAMPEVYSGLGLSLYRTHNYQAAIPALEKCIERGEIIDNPLLYYRKLGFAYLMVGQFEEAARSFERATQFGPDRQYPFGDAQSYVELEWKWLAISHDWLKPENAEEAMSWAFFAQLPCKKEYALAYRFYVEAFAKDPKLAGANGYYAACAAIQFAAGKDVHVKSSKDGSHPLHHQARDWLTANLVVLRKQAASGNLAEREDALEQLNDWLGDFALVSVRDPASQKEMPEDERQAWQSLWSEVKALRQNLSLSASRKEPPRLAH